MPGYVVFGTVISVILFWLAVYLLHNNLKNRLSQLLFIVLLSLSVFSAVNVLSRSFTNFDNYILLWKSTSWSYIVPVPVLFHIAVITINDSTKKKALIIFFYLVAAFYYYLDTTRLFIDYDSFTYIDNIGFVNPRGPLFTSYAFYIATVMIASIYSITRKVTQDPEPAPSRLILMTYLLYLFSGVFVVWAYSMPDQSYILKYGPLFLIGPIIPMLVGIIRKTTLAINFNFREFVYLGLSLLSILVTLAMLIGSAIRPTGDFEVFFLTSSILFLLITHTFYDWLTTFIRDLAYNPKKGFSIITDTDTQYIIANFHNPERLESSPIMKFHRVKKSASSPVDAAQDMIREAIEYFKQPDHPRRTKQNLKYQILRMTTFDEADEGQILWELGFEGYPMKIMSGEDTTRKPLFKIEAMSDYTAISRNAFIALKKEAIHDLTWRLSYLEKTSK